MNFLKKRFNRSRYCQESRWLLLSIFLSCFIISHADNLGFPTYQHPVYETQLCYKCPPGYKLVKDCDVIPDSGPRWPKCEQCGENEFTDSWNTNRRCTDRRTCKHTHLDFSINTLSSSYAKFITDAACACHSSKLEDGNTGDCTKGITESEHSKILDEELSQAGSTCQDEKSQLEEKLNNSCQKRIDNMKTTTCPSTVTSTTVNSSRISLRACSCLAPTIFAAVAAVCLVIECLLCAYCWLKCKGCKRADDKDAEDNVASRHGNSTVAEKKGNENGRKKADPATGEEPLPQRKSSEQPNEASESDHLLGTQDESSRERCDPKIQRESNQTGASGYNNGNQAGERLSLGDRDLSVKENHSDQENKKIRLSFLQGAEASYSKESRFTKEKTVDQLDDACRILENRIPTDRDLDFFLRNILGFHIHQVESIKGNNTGIVDKIREGMKVWKRNEGSEATVESLIQKLRENKRNDLADEIVERLNISNTKDKPKHKDELDEAIRICEENFSSCQASEFARSYLKYEDFDSQKSDKKDIIRGAFTQWRRESPSHATVDNVIDLLREAGHGEIADKILSEFRQKIEVKDPNPNSGLMGEHNPTSDNTGVTRRIEGNKERSDKSSKNTNVQGQVKEAGQEIKEGVLGDNEASPTYDPPLPPGPHPDTSVPTDDDSQELSSRLSEVTQSDVTQTPNSAETVPKELYSSPSDGSGTVSQSNSGNGKDGMKNSERTEIGIVDGHSDRGGEGQPPDDRNNKK